MEAGPGAETTDSCQAGDRRWPRIASCPREPGGEERFFRTDSRGAQPHVHLDFRHPVPRTVRQYAVLRDGSPRALTRGTLAAPSRALVALGGHGTRPVLPAVVLLPSHFMRGSKVTPLGCTRGDPGARLGPAVWGGWLVPKPELVWLLICPLCPRRPAGTGLPEVLGVWTGALSSSAFTAAGTDLPVWSPEKGVKPQLGPLSPRPSLRSPLRTTPSCPLRWTSGSSPPSGQGLTSGASSPVLSQAKRHPLVSRKKRASVKVSAVRRPAAVSCGPVQRDLELGDILVVHSAPPAYGTSLQRMGTFPAKSQFHYPTSIE